METEKMLELSIKFKRYMSELGLETDSDFIGFLTTELIQCICMSPDYRPMLNHIIGLLQDFEESSKPDEYHIFFTKEIEKWRDK